MGEVRDPGFPKSITVKGRIFSSTRAWGYRNPDGTILFWRVRFEEPEPWEGKKAKKEIRPFYFKGDKLTMKQPPGIPIPPLKADVLHHNQKSEYLLVEGEKCATSPTAENIESQDIIVTTLGTTPGKCNLMPFAGRTGYYLPDNDVAGFKKALGVKNAIPDIRVIPPFPEWKKGESIDDYDIDGREFLTYIEQCDLLNIEALEELAGITKSAPPDKPIQDPDSCPFAFLGYDEKSYFFMPKNQNVPIKIGRGNNSLKNNIEEIARSKWWFQKFNREGREGNLIFDLSSAMTWLRERSYKKGMFDDGSILGVGPHRDNNQIIINTGRTLRIYGDGEIDYNDYDGALVFCRSRFEFEIKGEPWTREQRRKFVDNVKTFGFEKITQMMAVIGWCAIAPFSSLLNRCPHIWLTASKGTGKTHLIDNIIEPAIGKFLIKIEGKTSEAGVRQSIGRDCRPVILDEFEANNKYENSTIENILGLARSAYGGSEIVKGTAHHEAIRFRTKMMFCFSSVKTYLSNAANASRIVVVRMRKSIGRMAGNPPMDGLKMMMFDRLEAMIENSQIAKEEIMVAGYDERTGDTYGPLLAGFWMVVSDAPFMQDPKVSDYMMKAISEIGHDSDQEDEDRILNHLFEHTIKIDASTSFTIAEMLTSYDEGMLSANGEKSLRYDGTLRRLGIRRMIKKFGEDDKEVLAISCNHQEIRKIMSDTAFSEYRDVVSRHPAFLKGEKTKYPPVFMAGKNDRAILLDWDHISNEFFVVPEGDDGVPF